MRQTTGYILLILATSLFGLPAFAQQQVIVGQSGEVMGYISTDNLLYNTNGNLVMDLSYPANDSARYVAPTDMLPPEIIGIGDQYIIANGMGGLLGFFEDGSIKGLSSETILQYGEGGYIKDAQGFTLWTLNEQTGAISDANGNTVAVLNESGELRYPDNTLVVRIDESGAVRDASDGIIGQCKLENKLLILCFFLLNR